MNEGLALLEKLKQAESEYETARKEYLDWYFNNAPLFEQKKLKMQLLLEDCAVIILTVTALSGCRCVQEDSPLIHLHYPVWQ